MIRGREIANLRVIVKYCLVAKLDIEFSILLSTPLAGTLELDETDSAKYPHGQAYDRLGAGTDGSGGPGADRQSGLLGFCWNRENADGIGQQVAAWQGKRAA